MVAMMLKTSSVKALRPIAGSSTRHGLRGRRSCIVRNFREEDGTATSASSFKAPSQEEIMDKLNSTTSEVTEKISEYWEKSEDKPTLVALGAGSLLALYFANSIVSAVNRLPLFAGFFELVGIAFSTWTAYRIFLVEGEKEKTVEDIKGFVSKVGIKL